MTKANTLSIQSFCNNFPVSVDMAGILYVEAACRLEAAHAQVAKLDRALTKHRKQLARATNAKAEKSVDAWTNAIQGIGGLEPTFGACIRDFVLVDVLLVASAEAYINSIAEHVLASAEFAQFDKLSPIGKWLFLPGAMRLKVRWQLDKGPLQEFAKVVRRRNAIAHPKPIRVKSVIQVEKFRKELSLDHAEAARGWNAVRDLIRQFSLEWRGSFGPGWLDMESAADKSPCFLWGNAEISGRFGRPGEKD